MADLSLEQLRPHPENPREIGQEALSGLKVSLEEFGDISGIVWNRRDGYLVCGHQRLRAIRERWGDEVRLEGDTLVTPDGARFRIRVVDWDEAKARAARLVANSRHIAGDWTVAAYGQLDAVLEDFPDFGETMRLDELRDDFPLTSLDDVADDEDPPTPEPPDAPITQPGDIWVMGDHRLMCGDSCNQEAVVKLLDDGKAKMIFTDPPWNVAIGRDSNPRHRQRRGLQNDSLSDDEFAEFLRSVANTMASVCVGDVYCVLGGAQWPLLDGVLREAGFHWSSTIVWVKDTFVLGRSKYHRQYEPIWYGWHSSRKSSFVGGRDKSDVWQFKRPKRSNEHPTMKPVDLVAFAITNSSRPGENVLDLFGGSGSTLIAAEKTGRKAFLMEIDPLYCDVIVNRWEQFTGKKAERVSA